MYIIRKQFGVEYAHQLKTAFSEGCWKTIHGHSGKVEVFFASDVLDEHNMVVDFGKVSSMIKTYLMNTYDHALIMPEAKPEEYSWKHYLDNLRPFNSNLYIVSENPTAEFFAKQMFLKIEELVSQVIQPNNERNFHVRAVRFHETDTGYAEYTPYSGCSCLPD